MKYQIVYIFIFYIIILIGYTKAQENDISILFGPVSEDCKKFEEFFKLNNYCCNQNVTCNINGQIEEIVLTNIPGDYDFNLFPVFSELKSLTLEGDVYKGVLPSKYFDLPKLESLWLTDSNIFEIPQNINPNSPIKEIYLGTNQIQSFPSQFVNLKYLRLLDINNNKLKGELPEEFANFKSIEKIFIINNDMTGSVIVPKTLIHFEANNNKFNTVSDSAMNKLEDFIFPDNSFKNDIFDKLSQYSKLKNIILNNNKEIEEISSKIKNLKNLESLVLSNTNIKVLPSQIFLLDQLKNFDISENPNLSTKIINFGNTTIIDTCNFSNTNILCYQPDTCANINSNEYNICTDEEIKEIIESQNENEDNKKGYLLYVLIGIVIFVIISSVVSIIIFILYRKSQKKNKDDNKNYNIIISSSSIKSSNGNKSVNLNTSNSNSLIPGQNTDISNRSSYCSSINQINPVNAINSNFLYSQNIDNYYMAPSFVPSAPNSYIETNSEVNSNINNEDFNLPTYDDIVNNPEKI